VPCSTVVRLNRSMRASSSGGDASDRCSQSIRRGVGVALRLSSIVFPVRTLPVTSAPTSFRIHQGRALQQFRQCHLRRSIGLVAHQAKESGCSLGPSSRPKTPSALVRSGERTLCLTRLVRRLGTRGLVSSSAPGSATALHWTVLKWGRSSPQETGVQAVVGADKPAPTDREGFR
jgi:hypothetical protein